MMTLAGNFSFGKGFLLKMTMGGSFCPLAWQPRTTVKDDFSFPVVRIDTVLVPVFSTVRFTRMSKVRETSDMLVMCSGRIFFSVILFLQ